jgi:hypothetical protein
MAKIQSRVEDMGMEVMMNNNKVPDAPHTISAKALMILGSFR